MEIELSEAEARVFGCLLEKEMTTPEYYPLTLHALIAACNQKTNRDPVVNYDETTVARALEGLIAKQLVWTSAVGRVPKYGENFLKPRNLLKKEVAPLGVLLLRGPQTPGELKTRTERMAGFAGLAEVEEALKLLEEIGFVTRLSRQPGQKESRYAHLFSGAPPVQPEETARTEPARLAVQSENERLARLEAELEELKQAFLAFKKQFE